jgi:hypothetical protein
MRRAHAVDQPQHADNDTDHQGSKKKGKKADLPLVS